MKRENILMAFIVLLVVMNGAVLFYFLTGRQIPPPRHDKRIIEALHFDDLQQQEFEKLKFGHRDQMNRLDDAFNGLLKDYFETLASGNTSMRDSLANELGKIEQQRVNITWDHFNDLKKLCKPEQAEDFNNFLPELIRFIVQRGPKNGPPPHPPERH